MNSRGNSTLRETADETYLEYLGCSRRKEGDSVRIYIRALKLSCFRWCEDAPKTLQCLREKLARYVHRWDSATQRTRDGVWKLTVNEAYLRTSNNRWHSPRLFTFPIGKKPDVEIRGGEGTDERETERATGKQRGSQGPRGVCCILKNERVVARALPWTCVHRVWSTFRPIAVISSGNVQNRVRLNDSLIRAYATASLNRFRITNVYARPTMPRTNVCCDLRTLANVVSIFLKASRIVGVLVACLYMCASYILYDRIVSLLAWWNDV